MRLDDLRGPECTWCGKELDPASRQTVYCCDAHNAAHRHHMEREARLAEKASWGRKCPVCETPIPATARADRIYCSTKCSHSVMIYRHRGAPRAAARAGRSCIECDRPINAARNDMHYCGNQCRQAAYRKRKRARKQASAFMCEAAE